MYNSDFIILGFCIGFTAIVFAAGLIYLINLSIKKFRNIFKVRRCLKKMRKATKKYPAMHVPDAAELEAFRAEYFKTYGEKL